ncbi:MAG: hypothetical protein GF364_22095 [Candidatus Lokiarchaeota archaeon]|nr:hypothetical protein [Candidatus Lokiarchaeota archaeon]
MSKQKVNFSGNYIRNSFSCPECFSKCIVWDKTTGDRICANCGLVITEHNFDPSHPSISIDELQNLQALSRKGKTVPQKLKRAFKLDKRLDWKTKSQLICKYELKRIGSILSIPENVLKTAHRFYIKARDSNLILGRSIKSITAACLFLSCRMQNKPRTREDILKVIQSSEEELNACCRKLVKNLHIKLNPVDPLALISGYAQKLHISHKTRKIAYELVRIYEKNIDMSGKTPKGIIAAALYLACMKNNEHISQRNVARALNISDVTLRSRYKELKRYQKGITINNF